MYIYVIYIYTISSGMEKNKTTKIFMGNSDIYMLYI